MGLAFVKLYVCKQKDRVRRQKHEKGSKQRRSVSQLASDVAEGMLRLK